MASNSHRQQIQEGEDGTQCKVAKSENLHQNSFASVNLKQPELSFALTESDDRLHFQLDAKNIYDRKMELEMALTRATNKRRYFEREPSLSRKISSLDLSLKLSPPGTNSKDEPSSGSSSFSSSHASCVSMDLNPNEAPPPHNVGSLEEEPSSASLILMGCPKCLIYVMVPGNDPHCPKCKNDGLIDQFRGRPTKKTRRN